jgi:hypothetical protein
MYARVSGNEVVQTTNNLRKEYPKTSFPKELPDEFDGWVKVTGAPSTKKGRRVLSKNVAITNGKPVFEYEYEDVVDQEAEPSELEIRLNALEAKGAVKIENFKNNQNKWVYAYLLTPQGIAEKTALTGSFLKRKMQEYEQLKQEIDSLTREVSPVVAAEAAEMEPETSREETLNLKAGGSVNG